MYFDTRTGDTHLVSDFAAHIIRMLSDRAMDMDTLRKNLLPNVDADDVGDLNSALPNILDELLSLEVVEQQ